MIKEFTPEQLHIWFRDNIDKEFYPYECELFKIASQYNIPNKAVSIPIPDENDCYDEVLCPPAELIVGNTNFRLEEFALDLLKTLLCSGAAEAVAHGAVPYATIIANLIYLAIRAGNYATKLSGEEKAFYQYLVLAHYTYSDRLRDIFQPKNDGFPLETAVNCFCERHMEENPFDNLAVFRQRVDAAVDNLIHAHIIYPKTNGRYVICF